MKTPIPLEDIKKGEIGEATKKLMQEGKVSKLDFEVAQILYKINEQYNISSASFYKALDIGKIILIFTKDNAGVLIGKDGKIVSILSSSLGKKVRIIQADKDVKKSIGDLISPARLLGINKIYSMGNETTKVRILKSDFSKLPMDLGSLEQALKILLEQEVKIEFE
jgi:transcription antitermination factor NusA-like protein